MSYKPLPLLNNSNATFTHNLVVDTDTLFVDSENDRVGIGTTSPSVKLDVNGSIFAKNSTFPVLGFERTTSVTTGSFDTTTGIASAMRLLTTTTGNMGDGFGGGIVFSINDNTVTSENIVARVYARRDGADSSGALQFLVGSNGDDPAMILRSSGNIGIGTTSPLSKLHVSDGNSLAAGFSTYWSDNDIILSTETGSSNAVRMVRASDAQTTRSSLNIIRSRNTLSSPSAVQNNDYIGDILFGGYGTTGIGYGAGLFAFADGTATVTSCPIRLSFVTGSNSQNRQERLTIKSSGDIGIGTTSPNAKLEVNGTVIVQDDADFNGEENTMPNQTLGGGDASVMTLGLTDERYGPIGKYEKDPGTITLQNSLAVATGSLFNGRLDQTYGFNFGAGAGAPPQIVFVPFFVVKPKNFTKAAINIVSGTSSTYDIDGCIYLPDENGYPLTRYGDVWAWDASATGKVEATINVGEIQGLFYVGIRPQVGATDWVADAGGQLTIRGVPQSSGGIGMILNQMFNIVPQAFDQYDGPVGVTATSSATSMPTDLSSPEIRRLYMWAAGNSHPSCILY